MRTTAARILLGTLIIGMASAPAAAESVPVRPVRPFSRSALERAAREAISRPTSARVSPGAAAQAAGGRDAIWNGGLIGAIIGGVGGSVLLVAASGGSDDFAGAVVKVAPLTAVGGFAIGAVIDALR